MTGAKSSKYLLQIVCILSEIARSSIVSDENYLPLHMFSDSCTYLAHLSLKNISDPWAHVSFLIAASIYIDLKS